MCVCVMTSYTVLCPQPQQTVNIWVCIYVLACPLLQQDEELSAAELDEVLARVLSCQQALTAVLQQPGNQLRLEAWCHRTQRVPLLPPTQQQRRHPDSNYRQAAFCVRWEGD